ncbi:FimV N-terminal domain-containing protein [Arsukibacterium tuosuense]|uniref:FimV N-terminal domain-containing protein n=1 Tax=Arsukibacterium tuosuense TaxID=1323745 RepID=A0A285INM0_9GAMM|nr:FimV/HubP family polar landmark protein [Arsukibacterium tuosuense]SNY49610.1 FimV N-terminal domain-containing protein [Arsukibacterium tuosuense]
MTTLVYQVIRGPVVRLLLATLLLTASALSGVLQAAELGPVAKTDTLWRLAVQVRPDEAVSMPQVVYALWQENPAAFVDGDINKLRAGSVLQVPARSKMLATGAAEARVWYYQAIRRPLASAVPPVRTVPRQAAVKPAPATSPRDSQPEPEPAASEPTADPETRTAPAAVSIVPVTEAPAERTSPPEPAGGFNLRQQHQLTLQQRYFAETGTMGQARAHTLLSLLSDWSWQDDDGVHSFQLTPFLRWHQRDSASNLLDLRQAYWRYAGSNWEFKAGNDIVFWGVSESQRLVDVINQVDMVGGVEMESRLGQPMLSFKGWNSAGTLELYLLPYFRERLFADPAGRLTAPWPVEHASALYESSDKRNNLDFALRWSQRFSSVDLGLSYFAGNSREPLLIPQAATQQLQPYYFQMQQIGVDAQYVAGDWLWKLESIYRQSGPQEFVAATAGYEYTRVGVFNRSWDLGWIAEYQYDSRGLQAPVTGQNDLFIGWRLALNDVAGSEVLLGVLQDLDRSSSRSAKLEASMRLTNSLRLRLNAWLFQTDDVSDVLYNLRQDDYLELSLDYYF